MWRTVGFTATANELHGMFPPLSPLLFSPPSSSSHAQKKKEGTFHFRNISREGIILYYSVWTRRIKKKKKKNKINSDGKFISAWSGIFPGIRGAFAGSRSFLPLLEVEIKNAEL